MDSSSISSLLANSRELVTSRWRQLAAAIGVTALLGAVLWFILIQLAGSVGGGDSSTGGLPSKGGIFLSITIAWAILISTFVVPMAASTAAIADEGDDSTFGWASAAVRSLPWMWLRLAIPTAPLLLLGLWAVNDVFAMFSDLAAQIEAGAASEVPAEPSEPLSFQMVELLFGSAPMRWAAFATVLGLWFLWSATRATGRDERMLPHAPWRLFGRSPLVVAGLAGISAVVLGPLLGTALKSLGSGLGSIAGDVDTDSAEGASTMAVLIVGMVISAFIGAVAIPWIALFREGDGLVTRSSGAATVDPVGASEPVAAAAPVTHAAGPPAATVQLVDQNHVAAANASAGAWWYLQGGANVIVQVAAAPGVSVTPVVSDAAGAWLGLQDTGQPGAASLVVPVAGWFLLGAWNGAPQPTQIAMRFTLPLDAQPAPQQQAQ